MLTKLGQRCNDWTRRYMPDPFVLALLLSLVVMGSALFYSRFEFMEVFRYWREGNDGRSGFWNLLSFGMQMCLILVTGHALAESPLLVRILNNCADRIKSPEGAIILVSTVAMLLGLLNWGLGLIAGALIAKKVGQRARVKNIAIHYPLVVAAGYTGLLVWHGGLSGSAPLKVTRLMDLQEVLGEAVAHQISSIPLSQTVFSASNIVVNVVLLVLVPWLLIKLQPVSRSERVAAPDSLTVLVRPCPEMNEINWAQQLENSRLLVWLVSILGFFAWFAFVSPQKLLKLDLNAINFLVLFVGLFLHQNIRSYLRAARDGVRGCTGIILQFPFYAGIMGMLTGSGLMEAMSHYLAQLGSAFLPVIGFYSAGLVNCFVPSGGGQWAVQGPLLIQAGLDAGVEPSRMVMALAYGDQWTNMLQPFWALPLLAITQMKARHIMGYTMVLLLISQFVFICGLYFSL